MENFPMVIIEDILYRLPIKTSLQAKRVCRTWRICLRSKTDKVGLLFAFSYPFVEQYKNKLSYGYQYDPILGNMKYTYSYDRLDTMQNGKFLLDYRYRENMLGSCNGLVCFGRRYRDLEKPFLICNPITGQVVHIPEYNGKYCSAGGFIGYCHGFGYCHSTNEYKIVSMHYQDLTINKYRVLVYTMGGGGWRSKGSINISSLYTEGIYANGFLHWLDRHDRIVAFDLEDEKFQFIPLTRFKHEYKHHPKLLGGNNLYFVITYLKKRCTDIWAYKRRETSTIVSCDMKKNYNDKNFWHWIKEFSIEWEEPYWKDLKYIEPMAITRNDELMLRSVKTIYCFDLKTLTLNKLYDGHAMGSDKINVILHANSVVSICCETDKAKKKRKLEEIN